MSALRLTDRERLNVLTAIVLDYLDENYTEGELENGPGGDLYNVATALAERYEDACINPPHSRNREADVDRDLTERLSHAARYDTNSRLARAATAINGVLGLGGQD